MNIDEACKLLEVSPTASKDEVKKSFRKLAAKFHPDNKESGNEEKFKKINEANQVLESYHNGTYRENPMGGHHGGGNPFGTNFGFNFNIEDFIGDFIPGFRPQSRSQPARQINDVKLDVTLGFTESVVGCKKEVSYDRHFKCDSCGGAGGKPKKSGCPTCAGAGVITARQGNVMIQRTCHHCGGRGTGVDPCEQCKGSGSVAKSVKNVVKIPGGVTNGTLLRIDGGGHFAGLQMGGEAYTNLYLQIKVENDAELRLVDKDVVSEIKIDLLEALRGGQREVKTILGPRTLEIPKKSKHKDTVTIEGLGVPGKGHHRVTLNVNYPEDVSDIINVLLLSNSETQTSSTEQQPLEISKEK